MFYLGLLVAHHLHIWACYGVTYPVNTPDTGPYAYYALNTYTSGGSVSLNLDSDGRLYLWNGSVSIRNITRGGFPQQDSLSLMRLEVGGIFRIYSLPLNPLGNWTQRWSSTDDACAPKGFCTQIDNVPVCQCLPGFEFLQSGNFTAGCSRSSSVQGCPKIDNKLKFEIRAVENTEWKENSYENLDTMSEEKCREACLGDCNCEAAFLKMANAESRGFH